MSHDFPSIDMQPSRRDLLKMALAGGLTVMARLTVPDFLLAMEGESAETIFLNGRIATMDPSRPEAEAVAVAKGRFLSVGSANEAMSFKGADTKVVDLEGRRVIPGLSDSHSHVVRGGLHYALELRWDGVPTLAEAMRRLREQVKRTPPGQWVRVVGGFSPWQFAEKRLPTIEELNEAAPDTPVFVLHLYTRALLNSAALKALGIDKNFPDNRYPGGTIERDGTGAPTGLLRATPSAFILYSTLHDAPHLGHDEQLVSSRHFQRELNRLGVTSTLDCGGGFQNWPNDYGVIRELHQRREMLMRIGFSTFIQRPGKELEDFKAWTSTYTPGPDDEWLHLIGGGEMLVLSAYDFEVFGLPRPTPSSKLEPELEAVVRLLASKKWPFRFHATYDETIKRHLDVLEKVHRDIPIDKLRWFIDHGETLSDPTIERIQKLGGSVAVQNRIAYQDHEFMERYGAEAAAQAPPIKKLMDMGVYVCAGTDMSRVSGYNPWLCLEWLVTGKGLGGVQLLNDKTRLDRHTALKLWTDKAWFSREEDRKGRIERGMFADFTALSDDYFSVPEERIRDLTSVLTVVNGTVTWGEGAYAGHMETLPPLGPDWSPVNFYGGYSPKIGA